MTSKFSRLDGLPISIAMGLRPRAPSAPAGAPLKHKKKMAGVNSRFASVSESKIVKIKDDSEPENTKKATNFGLKVFKDK